MKKATIMLVSIAVTCLLLFSHSRASPAPLKDAFVIDQNGNVTFYGDVVIKKTLQVMGTVAVDDDATLKKNLQVDGTLGVDKDTTLRANLLAPNLPYTSGIAPHCWYLTAYTPNGQFYRYGRLLSSTFNGQIIDTNEDFRRLLNLRTKSFRGESSKDETMGFIAEDVEAAGLKKLVVYDEANRPVSINHEDLPYYIFEVVKLLNGDAQSQRDEVRKLQQTLDDQAARIIALEAMLKQQR